MESSKATPESDPLRLRYIAEGMETWPWKPGRWFRVVTPAGELWAETSDGEEARNIARETGYRLERQWYCQPSEWREVPL